MTVELGDETFEVVAPVAEGGERDRLFAQHAAQLPIYTEYQQQTTRKIPVVVLQRLLPVGDRPTLPASQAARRTPPMHRGRWFRRAWSRAGAGPDRTAER